MKFKSSNKPHEEVLKEFVKEMSDFYNIHSIILYGSYNKDTYQVGWSDIDLMVVLKKSFNNSEFMRFSKKLNEIENKYNIPLSVNHINLSEIQLPTFGKPLIYLNELKNGKIIYGNYNPFKNCLMPDEETVYHNSVENLKTIVGDTRRLIRKIGQNGNINYYKSQLRLAIKYGTFSMKRACEIKSKKFCMTQKDVKASFLALFPNERENVKKLLKMRENWSKLNNKENILEGIFHCISMVERIWDKVYKETLSMTDYPEIEALIKFKSFPKGKESLGTDYQLEHSHRIYNMCKRYIKELSGKYKIDKDIVLLSALLHNSCKFESSENYPKLSGDYAQSILKGKLNEEKIKKIVFIIKNYQKFLDKPKDDLQIEFKIFLDAYLLDRLGYSGEVIKTLFFGDSMGRPVRKSIKYFLNNKYKFKSEINKLNLPYSIKIGKERAKRAIKFWEDLDKEYKGEY